MALLILGIVILSAVLLFLFYCLIAGGHRWDEIYEDEWQKQNHYERYGSN